MPGSAPQLSPPEAFAALRENAALDQSHVEALADAVDVESAGRAA
jgi:hypothetical protein